jgi:hypothetical protein
VNRDERVWPSPDELAPHATVASPADVPE